MQMCGKGWTTGSINVVTTHDVLCETHRVWSGKSKCKKHYFHTWATTQASQSVGCSAWPTPRSRWLL